LRPAIPSASPIFTGGIRKDRQGVYWGDVSDETFRAVTAHFAPPQPEEGFRIVAHPWP
jgi:hypothetical protein